MYLKFSIAPVILCLPFFLEEVTSSDDLEFWVRDPKFNFRRNAKKPRPTPATKTPTPINATSAVFRVHLKASNNKQGKLSTLKSTNKSGVTTKTSNYPSKAVLRNGPSIYGVFAGKSPYNQEIVRRGSTLGPDEEGPPHFVKLAEDDNSRNQWWRLPNAENKSEVAVKLSPYSILQQMIQLTTDMPEANITTEVLGRTAEYNDLVLLKVTQTKSDIKKYFRADDDNKYIDEAPEKKIIFIVHGLSVLGIDAMDTFNSQDKLQKLLSYYFSHLDTFDIFLMPMANPDGYAYIMNRMGESHWNKNMSPQSDCAGVSLDRNFDVAWNSSNTMSSCSQNYPGPSAFSEPESRAVRDVMHRYSHKMAAYLHVHPGTYSATTFKGDAVLYPKGFSDAQSDDDKYIDLKGEIDECMKNASFRHTSVSVETLHNWYGRVLGTSVDYASSVYGLPFAMELVMQVYPEKENPADNDLQNIALEEVWNRVIDVIFKTIHKNTHANEVKK